MSSLLQNLKGKLPQTSHVIVFLELGEIPKHHITQTKPNGVTKPSACSCSLY